MVINQYLYQKQPGFLNIYTTIFELIARLVQFFFLIPYKFRFLTISALDSLIVACY